MFSKSSILIALISVAFGYAFLAASVFDLLDHSKTSKLGPSLVQGLAEPFSLFWAHIFTYLFAYSALYGVAGGFFAWTVEPACRRWTRDSRTARQVVLLLFLLAAIFVTLLSARIYRHSLTGSYLNELANSNNGGLLILGLGAITTITAAAGLLIRCINFVRSASIRTTTRPALVSAASLLAVSASVLFALPNTSGFPTHEDRPHIVIIGIDGWRHDAMPGGDESEVQMPFVSTLLSGAAVIEEAWTPLARTFPAWWTILTGQFPTSNGVRFNLVPSATIPGEAALPKTLGELGYHRIFAMDERRFANISQEHHFDTVVGPAMGAADFLIGGVNDTPLSNLVVNTRLGSLLFPFTHANRAAYSTYRPETFSRQLSRTLYSAPSEPLFLGVHFEMPHWPFKWADSPEPSAGDPFFATYLQSLTAVDNQIEALFKTLGETSVLENALVVLLSDHGETFTTKNTIWTEIDGENVIKSPVGHGNSVLALHQHRVPLAFRSYGTRKFEPGKRSGSASLADIHPTLLDWMDLGMPADLDGDSLVPVLQDPSLRIPDRPVPLETGLNTDSSLEGILAPGRLFAEGAAYYNINRRGRLELKESVLAKVTREKQTAVVHAGKILASRDGPCAPEWLLDINTRTYTLILDQEISEELVDYHRRFFCDD